MAARIVRLGPAAVSAPSIARLHIRANAAAAAAAAFTPITVPTRPSSSQPNRPATAKEDANGSSSSAALTSYLTTLRLRAASALTSTLPAPERTELLKSLHAVDESAAQQTATRSIGEAVAAAVREETQRNETKWARERSAIEARAERAAMERVKHEVVIEERRRRQQQQEREEGMKRWKQELEVEKIAEERQERAKSDHPILGQPLIDLGYKRVHVVTAASLAAIPIWEKQRVYRHDRARLMASDKAKTADLGLPGIVTLHEATDGQLSILDGQHRVGMMAILQERARAAQAGTATSGNASGNGDGDGNHAPAGTLDLDRILVEVFPHTDPTSRPKHAQDIFTEINKAEPVKLVDMPGVARGTDKKVIDGAAEALRTKFPDMFKPSQRCRSPHLNVDNLRDALFAADVLKRHGIKSDGALVDWMMEKNGELAKRFAEEGTNGGAKGATKAVGKSALAKAEKFQFFLGLDSSWLYQ